MMELNRSGEWEQAAQLAQRFIDAKPEKSKDERVAAGGSSPTVKEGLEIVKSECCTYLRSPP